jgi:hypothetical protein
MTDGTVRGDGVDRFRDVEMLGGSPAADVFSGDPRVAHILLIMGRGGHDVLDLRTATRRQLVFTTPDNPIAVPSWVRFAAQDIRRVIGSPFRDRIVVGEVNGKELRVTSSGSVGTTDWSADRIRTFSTGAPGTTDSTAETDAIHASGVPAATRS